MIIGNTKIHNFLGIGKAEIDFNRGGLTLVEGNNKDSDVALSNGAGKSSLFEAPFWAIYGQTRRGLKGDDVVNTHTKGGCSIATELRISGTAYTVVRTRKHKPLGTTLKLYGECTPDMVDLGKDEVPDGATDLTRGTMRDTQEAIDELVGVGPLSFSKIVFFGQGDVKPFASLTDAELKMVFEQALGLGYFSENKSLVSGYATGLKNGIDNLDSQRILEEQNITLANDRLEVKRQQIAEAEEQASKWRKNLQEEIDRLKGELEAAEKAEAEREQEHHCLQESMPDLNDRVAKLKAMKEKLQAAFTAVTQEQANVDAKISQVQTTLNDLSAEQNRMQSLGGTCITCRQEVDPNNVAGVLAQIEQDLQGYAAHLQNCNGEAAEAGAKVTKVQQLTAPVEEQLQEAYRQSNEAAARITVLENEADRHKSDIGFKQNQLAQKESELASDQADQAEKIQEMKGQYDMLFTEVKVAESKVSNIDQQKKEQLAELELAEELAGILGNTGVKSYVFDAVTPELNTWANKYAQILDPDLGCQVSTVSKLKSGDFREKFSVAVTNQSGANSLAGSSGGERQKINLAIALAFNRLMRSMAGNDVPMLVLDEPFEALDAGSSDQVVELLTELDAENLYLITHNESVRDLIPHRIIMEKQGGQSTVTV